jgi:hypothetical protein
MEPMSLTDKDKSWILKQLAQLEKRLRKEFQPSASSAIRPRRQRAFGTEMKFVLSRIKNLEKGDRWSATTLTAG